MRHLLWATFIALSVIAVAARTGLAQSASPPSFPATPEPAECTVAPLAAEEIMALLATAATDAPAASPAPFAIPKGEPADEETSAAVTDTLRQVFACANAGDPLRFSALYTDDFIRAFYAGGSPEQVLAFLSAPPQPLPIAERRAIIEIGEVQLLPDGRAGVIIVLDEPADPRTEEPDYAMLEQVDGRWLVDEIHEG